MDRLTARRADNGLAYLVGVKPNEQEVDSPHPNTLRCILECFQSLAAYEDTGLTPGNITYQTAQLQEWQRKCNLMHRDNAQLRQVVSVAKAYQQAVEAKPDDYDEEEFLRAAGVLEKALGEYQELQEVR